MLQKKNQRHQNPKKTLTKLGLMMDSGEPEEEDSTDAPAPRKTSTRETRRPDYYGGHVYEATDVQKEPQTVKKYSEKEQWEAAMQKEMDSIYTNGVWDLVELPANRTPVGNKKKTKADGSIERYKAWLVAQVFFPEARSGL